MQTDSPFLTWKDAPLSLPAQERNLASETFFGGRSDICVVNGSDYSIFLTACKNAKALPARLFGIATVIRGHGGFDLHIRPELPKAHLSTPGDVASFIGLFPCGIPGISAYFTFYLGEIDVRVQWKQSGKWDISISKVNTIGKRSIGQKRGKGSKILYPLLRCDNK